MSKKIIHSMIAAIGSNRELGKAGSEKLLWHIPEDFEYFKRVTLGKPVIMGLNTFKAIGRPLPGRPNIVLTKDPSQVIDDRVIVISSLDEAYKRAELTAAELGVDEIFNLGGASVYSQSLSRTDRLYLTHIEASFPEASVFFPEYADAFTRVISSQKSQNEQYVYSFDILEK
jgi:dihydrofolate reductase